MEGTLSRCPEPRGLLSGMPLDIASDGGVLTFADRLSVQNRVHRLAQVPAIQRQVISGAAAVELAAITQGLNP